MESIQEIVDKYTTKRRSLVQQLKEVLTQELTNFMYTEIPKDYNIGFVTEKPDYIPQECWDHLFIKNKMSLNRVRVQRNISPVYFVEIDGIKIGFIDDYVFAFSSRPSYEASDDIVERISVVYNFDPHGLSSEKVHLFYRVCCEHYGQENTWLGIPKRDPEMICMHDDHPHKTKIIVKHPEFWCYDEYGLGFKIMGGITSFSFDDDGSAFVAGGFLKFGSHCRDIALFNKSFIQPHVKSNARSDYIKLRGVCRGGSRAALNSALSSYTDSPLDDEVIYNFLLNYDNLLSKEDEQGGPYNRMRKTFLNRRSRDTSREITSQQLKGLIINGDVSFSADVEDSGIQIKISSSSIAQHIEAVSSNEGDYYLHKGDRELYKRKIKGTHGRSKIFGTFNFNGREIAHEVLDHDPERFDLSGMDNDIHWSRSQHMTPSEQTIESVQNHLSTIVNSKLILEGHVNKIDTQQIEEELLGLEAIKRNTDPHDFF